MRRFQGYAVALLLSLCSLDAGAQADRKEVRAGNREFDKEHWQQAEIDYRRALVKDRARARGNPRSLRSRPSRC